MKCRLRLEMPSFDRDAGIVQAHPSGKDKDAARVGTQVLGREERHGVRGQKDCKQTATGGKWEWADFVL